MGLGRKSNSSNSAEHEPLISNEENGYYGCQYNSYGRSSLTFVQLQTSPPLAHMDSQAKLDFKPFAIQQPLTFYGYQSETTSTSGKTFCDTIVSHIMQFRKNHREFLAEFVGTLILVLLICGISAEEVLGIGVNRSWLTSSLGSGLAVLIAICIAGHVSGAHLNPAVTLTFWAFSGFPARKVPIYMAAQYLGAFTGAALLYAMIEPAISQFDHGERTILGELGTAGIFGTYPPLYVGIGSAVASEVVGTALLLLVIMVSGHPNNLPFRTAQGVMIAAGIVAISLGLGYTSGFSINPARDLGPRLLTAIAGWGHQVFTVHHFYAFVPMFAPFLGGLIGGLVFTIFID